MRGPGPPAWFHTSDHVRDVLEPDEGWRLDESNSMGCGEFMVDGLSGVGSHHGTLVEIFAHRPKTDREKLT